MSLSPEQYVQINQAVFGFANAYRTRMAQDEAAKESGLQLSDRSVIMVLGQLGRMNARQLAERMDINPGTISVYVQRLVGKGIVKRYRDRADRRNWWLSLTEDGLSAYQETLRGTVAYTRDFLDSLCEDEQVLLHGLLLRVATSLGHGWTTQ